MTPSAKLFYALVGLLCGVGCSHLANAQVLAARVDPDDISRVLIVRDEGADPLELTTFEGSVVDAAPAPSGRVVAAIVAHKPEKKGGTRTFRLHIIDEEGQVFRVVDHVQKFVFSPDERYIAVIRGNGYEGGPGFFPDSTEILGLQGPDLGPIAGLENATELAWSTFSDDGLVLLARVYDGKSSIMEYILETRVVVPTEYLGLHFSPDGRFYYLTPGESLRAKICQAGLAHDSCVRVFDRNGYRALSLRLQPNLRRPLGWADNQNMLLADERSHECEVYDVSQGTVSERFEAVDWRWKTRRGFVVRRASAKANFRKLGKPQVRALLQ